MIEYPLHIESCGSDIYIVMSRGHHDLAEFTALAKKKYPTWNLGGAVHKWCKTVPCHTGEFTSCYAFVKEGTRGAWPATYMHEYGEGWDS
jgi:hypothetical protein